MLAQSFKRGIPYQMTRKREMLPGKGYGSLQNNRKWLSKT